MDSSWHAILEPADAAARTAALHALWLETRRDPRAPIPAAVEAFLNEAEADDAVQAALIGLILVAREPRQADAPGVLARIFPALRMTHEPELQQAAIEAFGARSPRVEFDRLADLFADDDPAQEIARRYALLVLGSVDVDQLSDDAKSYAAS